MLRSRPRLRAACLALGLASALSGHAAATEAARITGARYTDATARYDHGILGDALEWGALELSLSDGRRLRLTLPPSRVFEDTAPRLADLDGDGAPEVVVVETDLQRGARLAVYGAAGLVAATDFIGRTHRWLAPAAIGDLNGDGLVDIAYVDRPHLRRQLEILSFRDGRLVPLASVPGVTNHRIGDAEISGGLRTCGGQAGVVLADPDWTRLTLVTFAAGGPVSSDLGPLRGPADFRAALACRR